MPFVGRFVLFWSVLYQRFHYIAKVSIFLERGKKRLKAAEKDPVEGMEEDGEVPSAAKILRQEPLQSRILCDPTSASYLEWKERTIREAELELGIVAEH